jgi:hypothetical protein
MSPSVPWRPDATPAGSGEGDHAEPREVELSAAECQRGEDRPGAEEHE